MLTKRQARAFFTGGTVLSSVVFLGLTVDTVRRVPEQTNQDQMTPAVVRGKTIWEENNCMGCHTLLGEGGYYAPELTRVYSRRGPEWMKVFLKDPQGMFPGERKMVQYDFTEQELNDLVAFFEWIDGIDANGWPPEPDLKVHTTAPGVAAAGEAAEGQPSKYAALCSACHAVGGLGGNVGPALDGVGDRFDAEYLDRWLKDPQAVKPGTAMPKLPLTDAERGEIVDYLRSLSSKGAKKEGSR